jgi:competence protein ComEA
MSGGLRLPAAERDMEPSATPPWRVLETPSTEPAAKPAVETTTGATSGLSAAVKVGAILTAAFACVAVAVVVALGDAGGAVRLDGGSPLPVDAGSAVPGAPSAVAGELVVEIVGAVPKPGVYRLPAGSRLVDLVRLAGGYGPRVDTARAESELNLAAPVKDGDHIRVPSRDDEVAAASTATDGGAPGSGLVDINLATQAELEELPGVGPATAEKIIAAREEAPFGAVEELRSRGVLGEKTFEKLRPLVTVG